MKNTRNMHKLYLQSCYDCGVDPSYKAYKKLKRKAEEQWSLEELNEYRKNYEEAWR